MKKLVYDPTKSGKKMTVVCFVSGSGTNYREVVNTNPEHHYVVFTNRPECGGVAIAQANKHEIVMLSHIPFLKEAKKRYGSGNVPRNSAERIQYEREVSRLIEKQLNGEPDLICLLGYDQWLTDWMVDKYYPRILNIHPGDTTRGYDGLHWIPSAKAILAGDQSIRSTLFFVDKGEDTGPVLVQSKPVDIVETLRESGAGRLDQLNKIEDFSKKHGISTYNKFKEEATAELMGSLEQICRILQDKLKVTGDWEIYPFAVHGLIGEGRVAVDGRVVYVDGNKLPEYGYRIDKQLI